MEGFRNSTNTHSSPLATKSSCAWLLPTVHALHSLLSVQSQLRAPASCDSAWKPGALFEWNPKCTETGFPCSQAVISKEGKLGVLFVTCDGEGILLCFCWSRNIGEEFSPPIQLEDYTGAGEVLKLFRLLCKEGM